MVKKEWYTVNAPAPFDVRNLGMTCVNRKVGMSFLYIILLLTSYSH